MIAKKITGSTSGMVVTSDPLFGRVLVVDDHAKARESMADVLRHSGYLVDVCGGAVEALKQADQNAYDVILTDLQMPGMSGLEFIRVLAQRHNEAQIVMVTAHATVASAVEAMRFGAFDYLEKPLRAEQLEQIVSRALRHAGLMDRKTTVPPSSGETARVCMIGDSPAMRALRARIAQVAITDETVLITGESGTGKELVARSVHAASRRAAQAMVSLNCPVLSAQLMESELFGHERGAFTSADAPRVGRFELADKGTILLDEVTEIDLPLQAKLLRVLQEQTFERVGSSQSQKVDVRVLATTNRDLTREVAQARFREDLYFRLAVVPLALPPLRERPEDIRQLIEHFRLQAARRMNRQPCEFSHSAFDLLTSYRWPGNVRELENIVTRSSVLCTNAPVTADQLRPWLIGGSKETSTTTAPAKDTTVPPVSAGFSLQEMEQKLIEATLAQFGGHRQKTADALGIGVRTLTSKLRTYGLAPRAKSFAKAA